MVVVVYIYEMNIYVHISILLIISPLFYKNGFGFLGLSPPVGVTLINWKNCNMMKETIHIKVFLFISEKSCLSRTGNTLC